jgi:hypothetical protein
LHPNYSKAFISDNKYEAMLELYKKEADPTTIGGTGSNRDKLYLAIYYAIVDHMLDKIENNTLRVDDIVEILLKYIFEDYSDQPYIIRQQLQQGKNVYVSRQDEIALLHASPLPGKEFIQLFKEENNIPTDSFVESFVEAYIPILTANL